MGADDVVESVAGERDLAAGTVVEQLPRALFRVALAGGGEVLAHAAERRGLDFLRLLPGDRVGVRVSPHDDRRGRIVRKESK